MWSGPGNFPVLSWISYRRIYNLRLGSNNGGLFPMALQGAVLQIEMNNRAQTRYNAEFSGTGPENLIIRFANHL
jgi:hypothetical protein